jgi:hypothetical protein
VVMKNATGKSASSPFDAKAKQAEYARYSYAHLQTLLDGMPEALADALHAVQEAIANMEYLIAKDRLLRRVMAARSGT